MAKANSSDKPGCADPGDDRLESWKDISTHLKRDIRTLHRWERDEAMPVHRHLHAKRGTVYAFRSELDQWRENRQPRAQPASSAARRVMLAVLPLENLSGPADDDHLAPGLTEDIITHLGRRYAKSIGIIARTSIVQYHRTRKPIAEIGRELGVEYVLEGTVRRSGDRVRITAQLILASDQTHVWAASYDRDLRDILSLQQEMAEAVAVRIGVTLAGSNQPVSASLTNPDAFEAYLKGRFHWYRLSPHHLEVALEYFDLALTREPRFAPAYEGIARVWLMRGRHRHRSGITGQIEREGGCAEGAGAQPQLGVGTRDIRQLPLLSRMGLGWCGSVVPPGDRAQSELRRGAFLLCGSAHFTGSGPRRRTRNATRMRA